MEEMTAAQQDVTTRMMVAITERSHQMRMLLERGVALVSEADVPDPLVRWGLEVCAWILRDNAEGREMQRLLHEHFADEQITAAQAAFEEARRDLG